MKNLLTSDRYRLKKQKSVLVLLIILGALMLLEAVGNGFLMGNAPWVNRFAQLVDEATNGGILISFTELRMLIASSTGLVYSFADVIVNSFSGYTTIFLTLFIAIYITQPVRTQYLKNIASEFPRAYFVFSDSIFLAVWCLFVTVLNALIALPFSFIFYAGLSAGNVLELILWIIIKFLLLFSIALCVSLFVSYLRRSGLAITFAILYIAVIGPNFFSIADLILNSSENSFRFSYLTPLGNYSILDLSVWHLLIGLLVAVLYGAVSFFLRVRLYQNRDIN